MREIVFIVFVVLLAFLYPHLKGYYEQVQAYQSQDPRSGYFIVSEPVLVETSPRIIEAKLISETSRQMLFEVTYVIPSAAKKGRYTLSVHPDMSHWMYSSNELVRGEPQTVEVRVRFRPQQADVTSASSTIMKFYLSHIKDGAWGGYVYQKDVPYEKIWR